MGLGVWFSEDLIHVLQGAGEGVRLLVDQRGLQDAADVAYLAGYPCGPWPPAWAWGSSEWSSTTV